MQNKQKIQLMITVIMMIRFQGEEVVQVVDEAMANAERELAEDAEWKRIQQNTFTRYTFITIIFMFIILIHQIIIDVIIIVFMFIILILQIKIYTIIIIISFMFIILILLIIIDIIIIFFSILILQIIILFIVISSCSNS